jgi:hypothetical protein
MSSSSAEEEDDLEEAPYRSHSGVPEGPSDRGSKGVATGLSSDDGDLGGDPPATTSAKEGEGAPPPPGNHQIPRSAHGRPRSTDMWGSRGWRWSPAVGATTRTRRRKARERN